MWANPKYGPKYGQSRTPNRIQGVKYGPSTEITVPKPYKAVQSRTIRQHDDNTGILLLVYLGFGQGNKQTKSGRGGCGGYSIST